MSPVGERFGGGGGGVSNPAYKPKYLHTLALTNYVQFAMAVSDRDSQLVFIYDYKGSEIATIQNWSKDDGTVATFESGPQGVCFDDDNNLIICDYDDGPFGGAASGQIHIFDAGFTWSDTWVPAKKPTRCAADGDYIYFVSRADGFVCKYNYEGVLQLSANTDGNPMGGVGYSELSDIAVDDTYLYIADTGNNRIVRILKSDFTYVDEFEVKLTEAGLALADPIGICADDSGYMYVLAEYDNGDGSWQRFIKIYNAAGVFQRVIFGDANYVGVIRSIALTPLTDIYYLNASNWFVGSLVLPFKDMGTWIYAVDAGEQTEFASASWDYEVGTPGQEVWGYVAVSNDGITYGAWSMVIVSGMPIPPDQKTGRYLKIKLELRQPSGMAAPVGWWDSPRVTSVLVLWEEAVWTFLEGRIRFYLQDPKLFGLVGGLNPLLELPFARVDRFDGEPQYRTVPAAFGYTKPAFRAQHVAESFSVTSDFYEKTQSFGAVSDFTKAYYIVLEHENENTGVVQKMTFWLCDFLGHSFQESDGGGPSQITLTYRPKLVT